MGKRKSRAWEKVEFIRPRLCNPQTDHCMARVVRELTDLLFAMKPGLYQIKIRVTKEGRFGLPK